MIAQPRVAPDPRAPRRARARIAAIALLAVVGSACATSKGYPGPERPPEELAVVRTAYQTVFVNRWIRLLEIQGPSCGGEPCSGETRYVRLLPGYYGFTVKIAESRPATLIPLLDLFLLGADVVSMVDNADTRQVVGFEVASGRTYDLQYDEETQAFTVKELEHFVEDRWSRPPLRPSLGAVPCLPPGEVGDWDLVCHRIH